MPKKASPTNLLSCSKLMLVKQQQKTLIAVVWYVLCMLVSEGALLGQRVHMWLCLFVKNTNRLMRNNLVPDSSPPPSGHLFSVSDR